MKKTSKPIIFFGNERLATGVSTTAPTLRKLIAAGYRIAAVVAHYEDSQSRNKRELEIATVARQHNIPVLLPKKLGDIADELRAYAPIAGVLVAYGSIIPSRLIASFPKGIINIHPSLLPLHRGPTPIESVILEGASTTGVSIMQLTKEMDAGPILAQSRIPLTGNEHKQELTDKLLELGGNMLLQNLPSILDDTLLGTPQRDTQATYDSLIAKNASYIDWNKSALQIEREIRAYAGWPKSRTTFGSLEIVITEAHILDVAGQPGERIVIDKLPVIYTGEQALVIDRLKPAGKQEMTGQAFLAGYKTHFQAA